VLVTADSRLRPYSGHTPVLAQGFKLRRMTLPRTRCLYRLQSSSFLSLLPSLPSLLFRFLLSLLAACPRLVPYSLSLPCRVAASETSMSMTTAHGRLLLARARAGADQLAALCCRARRRAAHARVWRRLQVSSAPLQPSRLFPSSGAPRDYLPLTPLLLPCLPVVYNAVSESGE
jgi:hypothetical protein